MNNIPKILRQELSLDPCYYICARKNNDCKGRITWEHALYFAGKQVQEKFSIIPLCWQHHLGSKLDKRCNEWLALNNLFNCFDKGYQEEMFKKYKKAIPSWKQKYDFLNKIYK
jgi:hypothetical protein